MEPPCLLFNAYFVIKCVIKLKWLSFVGNKLQAWFHQSCVLHRQPNTLSLHFWDMWIWNGSFIFLLGLWADASAGGGDSRCCAHKPQDVLRVCGSKRSVMLKEWASLWSNAEKPFEWRLKSVLVLLFHRTIHFSNLTLINTTTCSHLVHHPLQNDNSHIFIHISASVRHTLCPWVSPLLHIRTFTLLLSFSVSVVKKNHHHPFLVLWMTLISVENTWSLRL